MKQALDEKAAQDSANQTAALKEKETEIGNLKAEIETLKKASTTGEPENVQLKADATIGVEAKASLLQAGKAALAKLYTKADELAAQTEILEGITKFSALKTMVESYETQLEAKFPLTCANCSSTNVSRASRKESGEGGQGKKVEGKGNVHATQQALVQNRKAKSGFFSKNPNNQ